MDPTFFFSFFPGAAFAKLGAGENGVKPGRADEGFRSKCGGKKSRGLYGKGKPYRGAGGGGRGGGSKSKIPVSIILALSQIYSAVNLG